METQSPRQRCAAGKCGSTVTVNAGYHNSGFYDAGKKYVCSGIVGGGELCFPNLKRFELHYGKISTNVNFHDCAQISGVLTD